MDVRTLVKNLETYLRHSKIGDKIVKILLFGSQAKHTATEDSDIDILIFTSNGKSVEKSLMDIVYDFMLQHKAPLEVLTAGVDELFFGQDYFLQNIVGYGVEIYSMEKDQIKKIMLTELITLAEEYLEAAREIIPRRHLRLAIDAAYNAAELVAKAMILLKQEDLPGSHGGVVSLFGQLYVLSGEVDKELGRSLHLALKWRNEARYKPNALVSQENAQYVVNLAQDLLHLARRLS